MDIKLEQTDFNATVNNNSSVLLDFYADWCRPCQTLLPVVHKLADELKENVIIKKINVDENIELASQFNVRSIPTLIFFKDGKPTDRHTGLITEKNLRHKIDRLA